MWSMGRIRYEVRSRWPHVQSCRKPLMDCWRLYGVKPRYSLCLIDWTRTRFFTGKPAYWRIRLGGWTVIERNRDFSGRPN